MSSRFSSRKKYANKRNFTGAIIIVAAVFLVTVLNLVMLYRMMQQQVTELGTQNIENMQNNLQTMLDDASYMTRSIAYEAQFMVNGKASAGEMREWVSVQSARQKHLTNGYCFNVCYTSPDLIIVPGLDIDPDFDIHSRPWYDSALEAGKGSVYISEPYVDLASGKVCFTSVVLLDDGISTISLDFTMDNIQSMIRALTGENREAVIVNSDEQLVGCSKVQYLGTDLTDHYPDYIDVFVNLEQSKDTIGYIDKGNKTIFYCATDNEWYLVYGINKRELFGDTYTSMVRNVILSTILLLAIVLLMISNMRGHRKIKNALEDREQFFNNISGELKNPVSRILMESNPEAMESSVDIKENVKAIRESAMKLSGLVDNMLTYSGIQSIDKEKQKKKTNHQKAQGMGNMGVYVVALLVLSIFIVGIFVVKMMDRQASSEMERNVEVSSAKLTRWMTSRKNATDMLARTIEANPGIMEDYDKFVDYLENVRSSGEDVSLIYVGNAEWDTSVIMSDGWIAESGYVVQAYSWYSQPLNDEAGYTISQPFFDTSVREYCITISRPLYDSEGKFLGVLGMDYSLEGITSEFEAEYGSNGYTFLTTDSGLIINHPYSKYKISTSNRVDVRSLNYADALKKQGYVYVKDYDGIQKLCIAKADSISGFNVIVLKNVYEILGTNIMVSFAFILVLVGCIVLVVVIGVRIARWYETTNEGLHEAVERATAADKAKMQFLAQISHELRTPINAVLGMDELIMRESQDDSIQGYASDIQTAGHNLLELVNGLLDFSKIENGKMTLQEVEYNTSYMIKNTLNAVADRARRAGLELTTDIDSNLPSLLYGDDLKVRQVVVNLLTNAIKYTPSGSVKLTVKLVSLSNDEASIFFSVKDTGIGIKPEDRDELFKSFSRLDQEKNRSIEGTGLGLYIVNKILSMMNTKLELDSVYGEGSDFYFTVTQKVIDKIGLGNVDSSDETSRNNEQKMAKYLVAPQGKVLIVDDNIVNLKVAKGLLKRNEIMVDVAESGSACLDMLKKTLDYDIVFLDHMMPGMDGVETLACIRNEKLVSENVPVIVMTANAINGAREEYLAMGFNDYISKPLEVSVLESILEKWMPGDKISYSDGSNRKSADVAKQEAEVLVTEKEANEETAVASTENDSDNIGSENIDSESIDSDNIDIMDEFSMMFGEDDEISDEDKVYFTENIKEVDLSVGLSYASNSKSFYCEIVKELIKTKSDEELQKYFDEEDYDNYRVKVHAMKNNLRTIGATDLGEEAFALETAAKEGRKDFIHSGHQQFINSYADVMNKLQKWME